MVEYLTKKLNKVLFIVIMQEEIDSILENENFSLDKENSQKYENLMEFYTKKIQSIEIILVKFKKDPLHQTSVFGTELAFLATYNSIITYNPDLIVNLGYAGDTGYNGNLSLGTVCVANNMAKFHRRLMIVDFAKNTNEGNYPLRTFDNLCKELNYKSVSVGTSNSFVEFDDVAFKKGINLVEMELASVARACMYFNKVVLGIKIVSDNSEARENRDKAFIEGLSNLKQKFFLTFNELVFYLNNKSINEL